jgi:hypothetical protein
MFKVVLVVKQLALRLKQCEVDVVARNKQTTVPLVSRKQLNNGFCNMNATT